MKRNKSNDAKLENGIRALKEAEIAWLSKELGDAIAGLSYPVGMGIRPREDQLKQAAEILFDRYARMIELAARSVPG